MLFGCYAIKILQVSSYFKPIEGGSQNYCYELSKRLVERGHSVDVLSSNIMKNLPHIEYINGIKIRRMPCLGIFWGSNPVTPIYGYLTKNKYDVIHAHSYHFITTIQTAIFRRYNYFPFIIHLHGGIESYYPTNDLSYRIKYVEFKKLFDRTIGKWTIQSADLVASVSKNDLKKAKELFNLNSNKSLWLPNAVDENYFMYGKDPSDLRILFIGDLETKKGIDVLLNVAKHILNERKEVVFTIVGDGRLKEKVAKFGRKFPNRFNVVGKITHENIPKILANSRMLLLPSYTEGAPTVVLEALASGVPVVASNVGGLPEIIKNNQTGFLFPPGNYKKCVEKIYTLLDDRKKWKSIRENGRKLIENEFSWDRVVDKTEQIYKKMGNVL